MLDVNCGFYYVQNRDGLMNLGLTLPFRMDVSKNSHDNFASELFRIKK